MNNFQHQDIFFKPFYDLPSWLGLCPGTNWWNFYRLHFISIKYQRRQWHSTPVLLPGKSHGWKSLVGCSPLGLWESDTTEQLHFHFSFSCIRERNGNPLQYSCLENPRDRGPWWAVIYGATNSRTWMKRLSSSIKYTIGLAAPLPTAPVPYKDGIGWGNYLPGRQDFRF